MNCSIHVANVVSTPAGCFVQYQGALEDGRAFSSAEAFIPWSITSIVQSNNIVVAHAIAQALADLGAVIGGPQDVVAFYGGRA